MDLLAVFIPILAALLVVALFASRSLKVIGPKEVGLVTKRFGSKLREGNVIAMQGEAGYQADLLMPGLRFKLWPVYSISKHPWVQIPAGEIGVVIAQVGAALPIGAKSAEYRREFGNFQSLDAFLENGGQKGVQRPVLPPGTLAPLHPVAFLVLTPSRVYGVPVSSDLPRDSRLSAESFGLAPEDLQVTVIAPDGEVDMIGIVTVLEGQPLRATDIASRLGGFEDILALEQAGEKEDSEIIEALIGSKNSLHNNYQDFQAFLENGGRIGLQHDPLLYGAYLLNPFLVRVEMVPMLVVDQGQVAVIKSYVGLPTEDTSGESFKFGSIVNPGHRGIWCEPLRTGKYPINPRCYAAEIVPTSILTLNWAETTSEAHNLDASLSSIDAKSREGFIFRIDLQVQIHVPDVKAPKVISMVGTMQNLVNEVLQSAVGNYFRNSLQQLQAVTFIQTRDKVQEDAETYITSYLGRYEVETRGVYIQDVVLPEQLVTVLTQREIARQEKETYAQQEQAQQTRITLEKASGTADMQKELSRSQVSIDISTNQASARKAEADGQAAFVEKTGRAEATVIQVKGEAEGKAQQAIGLGKAAGYKAQVNALGQDATALVAVFGEISDGKLKIVPDVLVGGGGSSLDGLAGAAMKLLNKGAPGTLANGEPKPPETPRRRERAIAPPQPEPELPA